MDEILLVRVLTRLVRVHAEFGERCFEKAVGQVLLAIARTVHAEAEDRAAAMAATHGPNVVPLHRPPPDDSIE